MIGGKGHGKLHNMADELCHIPVTLEEFNAFITDEKIVSESQLKPLTTIKDTTAQNQKHTLPALEESIDKKLYVVGKVGPKTLTILTIDDKIADSLTGIETLDAGQAFVTLLADNENKTWHIVNNVGRWAVTGLSFYVPSSNGTLVYGKGNIPPLNLKDNILSNVINANIVANLKDEWTLSLLVKFDNNPGEKESLITQHNDEYNYWELCRREDGGIRFSIFEQGFGLINANSVTKLPKSKKYHQIDIVKSKDDLGLFINTQYEDHVGFSEINTFNGDIQLGQVEDLFLVKQNFYGVDPTSRDSITISRTNPFTGIYN